MKLCWVITIFSLLQTPAWAQTQNLEFELNLKLQPTFPFNDLSKVIKELESLQAQAQDIELELNLKLKPNVPYNHLGKFIKGLENLQLGERSIHGAQPEVNKVEPTITTPETDHSYLERVRVQSNSLEYIYVFHITNPKDVLAGKKPILEEKGPFAYDVETLGDTDNNIQWDDIEGTVTYRPRKIYHFNPSWSAFGYTDPKNTYVTVPNLPFWTAMNKIGPLASISSGIDIQQIKENGGISPFINVSVDGLLWGYQGSNLPCLGLSLPKECQKELVGHDSISGDDGSSRDPDQNPQREATGVYTIPSDSTWEPLAKPQAEYVNCKCEYGIFRDKNVTMREPITILTGATDFSRRGLMKKLNGESKFGWWKSGSSCDEVKGQDAGMLVTTLEPKREIEIFVDILCRPIKLQMDGEFNITTLFRFAPPKNSLGAHNDPNPEYQNPDNKCYCLARDGFKCYKSGVFNVGPCNKDYATPLAISFPHFFDADESYREGVIGLDPNRALHEFHILTEKNNGFVVSVKPNLQLNVDLFKVQDVPELSGLPEELLIPFIWIQRD